MSAPDRRVVFALASRKGADSRKLAQWLEDRGYVDVRWADPRDVDEVERVIREGGAVQVVLPSADALLAAAWSGRITLDLWRNVTIEIADETPALSPAALRHVLMHWDAWRSADRARSLIAAVILSLLAILAASLVLWAGLR